VAAHPLPGQRVVIPCLDYKSLYAGVVYYNDVVAALRAKTTRFAIHSQDGQTHVLVVKDYAGYDPQPTQWFEEVVSKLVFPVVTYFIVGEE